MDNKQLLSYLQWQREIYRSLLRECEQEISKVEKDINNGQELVDYLIKRN